MDFFSVRGDADVSMHKVAWFSHGSLTPQAFVTARHPASGRISASTSTCQDVRHVIDSSMKSNHAFAATALRFSPEEKKRAEELGIDLGLIAENLALTPAQRAEQHDSCLRQVLEVQERLGVMPNHDD